MKVTDRMTDTLRKKYRSGYIGSLKHGESSIARSWLSGLSQPSCDIYRKVEIEFSHAPCSVDGKV